MSGGKVVSQKKKVGEGGKEVRPRKKAEEGKGCWQGVEKEKPGPLRKGGAGGGTLGRRRARRRRSEKKKSGFRWGVASAFTGNAAAESGFAQKDLGVSGGGENGSQESGEWQVKKQKGGLAKEPDIKKNHGGNTVERSGDPRQCPTGQDEGEEKKVADKENVGAMRQRKHAACKKPANWGGSNGIPKERGLRTSQKKRA